MSVYDPDCGRDLVKETEYHPDGSVWRKLCRACVHGTREPGAADKCLVDEMCALGNGWQCRCNGTDIVATETDMVCTSIPAGEVSAAILHPAIRSVDLTAITAIDLGDLRRLALSNQSTGFPIIKMVRILSFERIPWATIDRSHAQFGTCAIANCALTQCLHIPSVFAHSRSRRRPTRQTAARRHPSPPQPARA